MTTLRFLLILALLPSGLSIAQEPKDNPSTKLIFKTEWKGERIALPPEFAPKMKLKGIEEIRFAPGMFKPDSDSFFSYAFVFEVSQDQKLTRDVIHQETLVYYRGLAGSILKRKGKEVDVGKFTFKLEQAKAAKDSPATVNAESVTQYVGKLDWIEPFATAKPQVLHFELQSWSDPKTKKNYLFVSTSPKAIGEKEAIWTELRKIRRSFEVKTGD
jgi:hypothetical protein